MPDDNLTSTNRTFFLGLRLSDGGAGESPPTSRRWHGTVYDQMEPLIDSRFWGMDTLSEGVLDVIDRIRSGERGLFVRGAGPPSRPEIQIPEDDDD